MPSLRALLVLSFVGVSFSIAGDLTISENPSLSDCEAQVICNYLADPAAAINIYSNADGCDDPLEVASGCGIELQCLPNGNYYLLSQEDVDSFQVDYPECTDLAGNVTIGDVTNLNGLNSITSIGGNLEFWGGPSLTSLSGLDSLNFIGGNMTLVYHHSLPSLEGLGSLSSCGGDLIIACGLIPDLYGLNALSSIGGDLYLGYYSIGGYLGNLSLTSLSGLEALNSIGGSLYILGNPLLSSLSNLEDIEYIGGGITITSNPNLADCAAQGICNYMSNPNGTVDIYGNAPGCNTQSELAGNCAGTSYCLPYGNYYFFSQADIDSFPVHFSGCTELGGIVSISGLDISNLAGLNQVTSINSALQIGVFNYFSGWGNPLLTNLTGLENLTDIGGALWINKNDSLISLDGLENLTSIGGGLLIGYDYVGPDRSEMSSLASLEALGNVTSVGGELCVRGTAVTSLSGLDNISPGSIFLLYLSENSYLTSCAVKSVCDYLASPDASTMIWGNAPGCNSEEEVEAACLAYVPEDDGSMRYAVRGWPNPFIERTNIEFELEDDGVVRLVIYNHLGQEVAVLLNGMQSAGKHQIVWNADDLPPGIYYLRLTTYDLRPMTTGKLVKY